MMLPSDFSSSPSISRSAVATAVTEAKRMRKTSLAKDRSSSSAIRRAFSICEGSPVKIRLRVRVSAATESRSVPRPPPPPAAPPPPPPLSSVAKVAGLARVIGTTTVWA